ncbi:hypothetical protein [Burkholderia gladioli]|uniref:hypothetical protein n=1 Tax=Burkholderia gladioli TaxID=28095 RepID=UPI00163EF663|nr:hypothetical protein [Burkholderia gladioli]
MMVLAGGDEKKMIAPMRARAAGDLAQARAGGKRALAHEAAGNRLRPPGSRRLRREGVYRASVARR